MQRLLRYLAWLLAFGAGICAAAGPTTGFQIRIGGNGAAGESSETGPYTLSGVVVDTLTGAPIRRALVQLVGAQSRFALTDEGGRFQFENLPRGEHSIDARKPGYADLAAYGESYAHTMVAVGAGTAPVVLKLEPQSTITVQVTDEDGDAVENLPVRVLGSEVHEGRRHWIPHGGGQTDDEGEFRAGNLRPGKYYVSVGPSSRPVGHVGEGAAASDVGYPRRFYPNAADMEAAAPVELGPGKRMQVKFSVSTAPLYRISGAVVGGRPGEPCYMELADSSGDDMAVGLRVDPTSGLFRSGELPAGFYTLTASYYRDGRILLIGEVALRVDSDLANVTVAVSPAVWIPVTYRINGGGAQPMRNAVPAFVMLSRKGAVTRFQRAWSQPEGNGDDWRMVVKGVMPGTYEVDIRPTDGESYVETARYGQVDLLTDDLTVPQGGTTEAIEITLGKDGARASGNVRGSGGATPASGLVLFIPGPAPRHVKTAQIERGGYSIGGLAPGSYRVIALDRADDLEYTNPEVLRDFLTKAQDVTLSPKQETHVDLEILHRER